MSWDASLLSLEVQVEFTRLSDWPWLRIEDAVWQREHVLNPASRRSNTTYYAWHKKRPEVRAKARAYTRARYHRAKAVVVAVRGCAHCGKPFALTMARERKGEVTLCSATCALLRCAARRSPKLRIGAEELTMTEWCKRYGKKPGTVHHRIALGWTLQRALETPVFGRWGQR
jgi:hypothetical protein